MKNKKRFILVIAVNALCLIAFAMCQIFSRSLTAPLNMGQAARAWAGESGERFAQLSVFLPASYEFDEQARRQLRQNLDSALLQASLEADENRRLYVDAWSGDGQVSVIGERGNANAFVTGVGGDYFLFHPMYLRSGNFISPSDIMQDRVILDEELAWRLYGSVNLAGLEVTISGRPFVIAGVVARETDRANAKAYTDGPGMYMSFDMLSEISGGAAKINSYEIVLPDIVSDFAVATLEGALQNEQLNVIDSTERFSFSSLLSLIRDFGHRGMRTEAISYPHWENAIRYAEDWAALMLALSMVLLICPAIFAAINAVKLILIGIREAKILIRKQIKKRDDRAYEKYKKKQADVKRTVSNEL